MHIRAVSCAVSIVLGGTEPKCQRSGIKSLVNTYNFQNEFPGANPYVVVWAIEDPQLLLPGVSSIRPSDNLLHWASGTHAVEHFPQMFKSVRTALLGLALFVTDGKHAQITSEGVTTPVSKWDLFYRTLYKDKTSSCGTLRQGFMWTLEGV